MTEALRIQSPNILFHVINRGNAKQVIFREAQDFRLYLELLSKYKTKFDIRIYHFALMSNHVHLLLEATRENTMSKFMQGLTIAYTKRFNKKYQSVGHVWQARFRSIPIETDSYYLQCARYIGLNPIRANLVRHPIEYPWSTYSHSTQQSSFSWIDTHPLLQELQKKKNAYQQLVENEIEQARQHRSQNFSRFSIYGTPKFIKAFSDLRYL